MSSNKRLLLTLFLIWSFPYLAQIPMNPNIDLVKKNIGKTIHQSGQGWKSESTYLGKITDQKGRLRFYVVKVFTKIKAAIVYHGTSKLIFYNSSKNFYAFYQFSMPGELPFKLQSNCFYFHNNESKPAETTTFKIACQLPRFFMNSSTISYNRE